MKLKGPIFIPKGKICPSPKTKPCHKVTKCPLIISLTHYPCRCQGGGRPGASLYAFKQYLPNANIYGADIDKNILFNEERINTCYVDQLDIKTFDNIKNTFGNIKYDLIIVDII